MSNLILKVNNNVIHDPSSKLFALKSYNFGYSFFKAASEAKLVLSMKDINNILLNDEVEIIVDGFTRFSGFIDTIAAQITRTNNDVTVTLRSKTAQLLDNDLKPQTYLQKTDNYIIQDVMSQFPNLTIGNLGKAYQVAKGVIDVGQNAYDFMAEIAAKNNFYIYIDETGTLFKVDTTTEGTAEDIFDIDQFFDGTFTITQSIANCKSDLFVWDYINKGATSATSLQGLLNTSSPFTNLYSLVSEKASNTVRTRNYASTHIQNTKVIGNGEFVNMGRLPSNKIARFNPFTKTSYRTYNGDNRVELDAQGRRDLERFMPEFSIDITLNKLWFVNINSIVNINVPPWGGTFTVRETSYSEERDKETTTLKCFRPNFIR